MGAFQIALQEYFVEGQFQCLKTCIIRNFEVPCSVSSKIAFFCYTWSGKHSKKLNQSIKELLINEFKSE